MKNETQQGRGKASPSLACSPCRVTLSRRKGWRMPPNTVRVCRPTKWGNPFKLYSDPELMTKADCVKWFRKLMEERPWDVSELRGKNLACWCKPDEPCHADVLLDLANGRAMSPGGSEE